MSSLFRKAALAAALALSACTAPAPVPPPPATVVELKRPDDLVPALSALIDIDAESKRLHLRQPKSERYFRVESEVAFASLREHYAAKLVGWRPIERFPTRVRGGLSAAWSGGGQVFAIVLIPHADRLIEGGGPDQLLIVFSSQK